MKHAVLALLLLLCIPLAHAEPPSDAQVDKLLEVMRARQTIDAVLSQVEQSQRAMVQQMTAGQTLSAEQRKKLDAQVASSSAEIRAMLSWEKLQPLYREVYRQTFDATDVDAMATFYGSPPGQHLLDKMPQLLQNTMAAMQKLVVPMLKQMQEQVAADVRQPAKAQ